ncbi:hypothetical protein WICPIJ_004247 [Wickerhamomyces pijperi]|uniref:Uncharacterized protein n=1 Tax=Wickerhamomyces pijperi TaxID=599730 RepID=A0A9P8TM83_WICPI|nr:hypothetical protein WICPIJ_004247 [Wickerhamomyces pijperi]
MDNELVPRSKLIASAKTSVAVALLFPVSVNNDLKISSLPSNNSKKLKSKLARFNKSALTSVAIGSASKRELGLVASLNAVVIGSDELVWCELCKL